MKRKQPSDKEKSKKGRREGENNMGKGGEQMAGERGVMERERERERE